MQALDPAFAAESRLLEAAKSDAKVILEAIVADASRFGWESMLGGAETVSPYCSPATAEDLSGLPPTSIQIGAIDLFLEESLD